MVVTNLKQFGGQCLANRLDKQHDSNYIGHSGRGEAGGKAGDGGGERFLRRWHNNNKCRAL